jgi:hypothetical protein
MNIYYPSFTAVNRLIPLRLQLNIHRSFNFIFLFYSISTTTPPPTDFNRLIYPVVVNLFSYLQSPLSTNPLWP